MKKILLDPAGRFAICLGPARRRKNSHRLSGIQLFDLYAANGADQRLLPRRRAAGRADPNSVSRGFAGADQRRDRLSHRGQPPPLTAALRGIPVRVVACFTPGLTTAIIARPEIKTVQDLKGKIIGLNSIGGGLESTVRLMLKHYGLDPDKDVKFLATGGIETRFAALKQNLTVATAGSTPADYLGKKFGYVVLARAYDLFSYPNTGFGCEPKKKSRKAPISSSA